MEKAGTSGRVDLWKGRPINAWQSFINPPASAVAEVLMARAGKLIGLEESLRNGLIEKWGYVDYTIPAGTYKSQDKPIDTVGLPMVFFAREDVSDEVVYLITKTVAEMKDRLVKVNPAFQRWEPDLRGVFKLPHIINQKGWFS